MKQTIVDWIDADREAIVAFVQTLVRARSPNPPGDTRAAMAPIRRLLDDAELDHAIHAVTPEMPNLVAAFDAAPGDRHLVLNGHIDVFPVEGEEGWRHPPWSGDIADGAMFGRGVADMKAGTAASVLTYAYLARLREHLAGRLTLTVVSDEETLGAERRPPPVRHLPRGRHRNRLPERRTERAGDGPLRREGVMLAALHRDDTRRPRRLHPCQRERGGRGDRPHCSAAGLCGAFLSGAARRG